MQSEGLDVPETVLLLSELKEAGLDIKAQALSVADCADIILGV